MRDSSIKLDNTLTLALQSALSSHQVQTAAQGLFSNAISNAIASPQKQNSSLFGSAAEIQRQQIKEMQQLQKKFFKDLQNAWKHTTKAVLSAWESMWQSLVEGFDGDKFLSLVLDMLAKIAAAFGQLMVLSGIAMQSVPIFGSISGAEAIAAGMSLIAFAGLLKGASSLLGSSGSHSQNSSQHSGFSGGANAAAMLSANADISNTGGSQVVYNITIDSSGSIDTAESIAQKLDEVIRRGRAMGYSF